MACLNDDEFGPSIRGCRGDFDFTQQFERIFFSIIPAAVFIALALTRVAVLSQQPCIVKGVIFQFVKLAFLAVYAATQLALLALLATVAPGTVHGLSLASAALAFVASLFATALSFTEHSRARRPSVVLGIYIFLTILFDIAQTRTAWLSATRPIHTTLARLFTSSVAVKVVILVLEAYPKTRWISWNAEEHSPEESSSIFSLGVYGWLNRLFLRGYKDVLAVDDLYPLDSGMTAEKMMAKLTRIMRIDKYRLDPKFGLVKDIFRSLIGPLLLPVAPRIALIGFKFCQPLFIQTMLEYLQESDRSRKEEYGYGLIGACGIIYIGIAVSSALYQYYNQKSMFKMRGFLVSATFKKTTETALNAADDSAAITLMSTDIENIMEAGRTTHEVWANTIETALGCWLLQTQVGTAFVSPVALIIFCALILSYVVTLVSKRQHNWMSKIQNRVGLTANAISNMKLYKISGITGPVADLIQNLRTSEIRVGNQYRWLLIWCVVLAWSPLQLAPLVTFAVATVTSKLDATTMYTSLSYIVLVTMPLSQLFQGIPELLAALACIQRIQKYLVSTPRVDYRLFPLKGSKLSPSTSEKTDPEKIDGITETQYAFTIENGGFGWGGDKMTLHNINAKIPANSLTLVVGPVASGKSTFCKVLLGEMPVHSGRVSAFLQSPRIGYCEQTPFLYNATLKENVIGHCQFVQSKYDEIVNATLLAPDVALLPQGHDTKIGSNGIMLSGGQKQRVSVARALYSEAAVLIFDDILSGLDTDTESEIFRRVFGPQGIIQRRNATAVVCTHSVRHLPFADHIIALGADGTVVEEGSFAILMTNNNYVQSLGVKSETSDITDKQEEEEKKMVVESVKPKSKAMDTALDDRARQMGDWSVYAHYFRSVNSLSLVALVASAVMYGFGNNFDTIWMSYWAADGFGKTDSFYIGIYALLKVSTLIAIVLNVATTMISMITYSGTELHKRALSTVVSAPLRFFTTTDSGVVTNLFSQDMTLIDGELPLAFTNTSLAMMQTIGSAFVIASASPFLAISYPLLAAVLYALQKGYLRTSRQMRLLDLEAKSPLYTHFIDTIKGVATIRAFGWSQADIDLNNALLDTSQRPAYLLAMIQKWLTTTLQFIVAGLGVLLVALSTQLGTSAGITGASLVTLLTFGDMVAALISHYTRLETSIGAISRLRTFSAIVKPEDQPGEDFEPPEQWPQNGRIDIQGVSASYDSVPDSQSDDASPGSPSNLVIRDLTLTIPPGQKVAVCGRTGSGKSTLILLLLRLLDPLPCCADKMEIDGVPFRSIDRTTLRKRIIAIPQDAVFLPDGSSIKHNIDPLDSASGEDCAAALKAVRLAGFVADKGGLQAGMSADDLSAGQKQLFSLGRAILRRRVRDRKAAEGGEEKHGGILLLDEVSSSVDKVTDRAMQEIIREEFAAYTIVMVSHRLEMVVDFFDRVVVLDKGALVEEGDPRALIDLPGSRFGELWAMGNHTPNSQ